MTIQWGIQWGIPAISHNPSKSADLSCPGRWLQQCPEAHLFVQSAGSDIANDPKNEYCMVFEPGTESHPFFRCVTMFCHVLPIENGESSWPGCYQPIISPMKYRFKSILPPRSDASKLGGHKSQNLGMILAYGNHCYRISQSPEAYHKKVRNIQNIWHLMIGRHWPSSRCSGSVIGFAPWLQKALPLLLIHIQSGISVM